MIIMKKTVLYILAFIAVIISSCDPLKDSINDIKPATLEKTMALTLTTSYASPGAANEGVAKTLNSTYKHLDDGSKANVIYNLLPAQVKAVDSLLSNIVYTVTDADYLATNGNSNKNFNTANLMKFINAKFPVKTEKQLFVISYAYFQSGVASPAVPVTESYLYLNGAWVKIYHVTPAQYTSAGKLNVFNFGSADEPNLTGYFNTFLKADASASAAAKLGDVKYVSFTYFVSSSAIYQRIKALVFDGVNWGTKPVAVGPFAFLKKKGTWIPDPTVYYTLVKADFAVLTGSGVASEAAITNAVSFASFDMSGGPNNWTEEQIVKGVAVILNTKFASAPVDETVLYKVTYGLFKGPTATDTETFAKTSAGFVFVKETD